MRRVKFKRWIPAEYEKIEGYSRLKKGTRQWEDDYVHDGLFHQWGLNAEEYEVGAASYSIGIIELPDGTMEEVLPTNIKFVDPY